MELVGRAVKKRFPGFGLFSGVVESYDPSAGYFKVLYEDGDSEEVEFEEIAGMLMETGEGVPPPSEMRAIRRSGRGRRRNKRRRREPGPAARDEDVDLEGGPSGGGVSEGNVGISDICLVTQGNGGCWNEGDFAVQKENSEEDKDGFASTEGARIRDVESAPPLRSDESIDIVEVKSGNDNLNEQLFVSKEVFNASKEMKIKWRLNLEGNRVPDACLVTLGNGCCQSEGNFAVKKENFEEDKVCFTGTEDANMCGEDNAPLISIEGITMVEAKPGNGNLDDQLFVSKEGVYTSSEMTDERRLKKRRRGSANVSSSSPIPLRRSARKVHASLLSSPCHGLGQTVRTSELDNQAIVWSGNKCELVNEELMPELPPSSTDLDLDGLSIPDFFSVYSCLRSFSRVLFLSPFRLEVFLAALRCKFANSLIDSIHFSILQTLRCHLELLAEEGSELATCCIRSLNWDLLGLITWPVFLAQYILVHGSRMKSKCKLTHLNLLDVEYYKQPANVKLEVLRCLCDDVIEVQAIRSELNMRSKDSDSNMDGSDFVNLKNGWLEQDMSEGVADWNRDDCCLCRLDGNLICCDGCPAAFHSRCVGVAEDLLPEGDWFCPECLMDRCDGLSKMSKSSQGAEFLGIDPHGRLYFGSCGYLLVCDSYDVLASYHFYNKGDLDALIKILKSSGTSYSAVVNAISSYWECAIETSDARQQPNHVIVDGEEAFDALSHSSKLLSSDRNVYVNLVAHESKLENGETKNISASNINQPDRVKANQSSENTDEIAHIVNSDQLCQRSTTNCYDDSGSPVKEVVPMKPVNLAIQNKRCFGVAGWSDASFITEQKKDGFSGLQFDACSYVNNYSFGRIASSCAKEVIHISSDINSKERKTDEDIVSAQTNIILKRSINSCLHNDLTLSLIMQKEKCGWCHACKTCSSKKCIFVVSDDKHLETPKPRTVGFRSERKKKSHIVSVMRQILSLESNVRGLLSGLWDNPQHSNNWRKSVLKASDVSSLGHLLLMLEHNLRVVALSPEWMKPVDFSYIVGSASQVSMNVLDASSSSATRKQRKKTMASSDSHVLQVATTSSTWWRGGKLSRQLFHWNTMPHSLAFKGGRQAGCKKISNLVYPDGSDLARISKFLSWRASVEMSKTFSQLTFNIKELGSNIRWSEFSKAQNSLNMTKDSKSSAKMFKKVIIQRKCVKGIDTKYLLDFGKRGNIPPVVTKYGDIFEDSASDRKKYWLSETHVPLNLIKAFEEKKLARIQKKQNPKLSSKKLSNPITLKRKRRKDLSHLFKRAAQLESELCALCKKDVLIREAVSCQICNEFFHKKHFRLLKHSTTATYICYGCKNKQSVKSKLKGKEVVKKKEKNPKCMKLKPMPKKADEDMKDKNKNKKAHAKKTKNNITCTKRKRTIIQHSFWLNGLLWIRKPDDTRGKHFRERNVLLPFQTIDETRLKPICCLCFKDYSPEVIYVVCENCQDWFHGDIYQLTLDNITSVIGFKCHNCRAASIPTCPFSQNVTVGAFKSPEGSTIIETTISEYQGIKEMDHNGTCEERHSIVGNQHCLDLQKYTGITCTNDKATFDHKTVSPTVLHNVQSLNCENVKIKSSCLENAIHVDASDKKFTYENARDSEFVLSSVSNTSTDPHL